jgi:hypothetical protein
MDNSDINFLSARRGSVGTDTYIPQETSTASTSPRSMGAPDDLSRMSSSSHKHFIATPVSFVLLNRAHPEFPGQRRREPLPLQNHHFKEASDMISRPPPLSGPNRIMHQPQPRYVDVMYPSCLPTSKYPAPSPIDPSLTDHESFSSRHPDSDALATFDGVFYILEFLGALARKMSAPIKTLFVESRPRPAVWQGGRLLTPVFQSLRGWFWDSVTRT